MAFSESDYHLFGSLLAFINGIAVPVLGLLSLIFFLISRKWRWLALNSLNALLFPVGMTICLFCMFMFPPFSIYWLTLHLTVGVRFIVCPAFTLADAWKKHDKCLFAAALTAIGFYVSGMLFMIGMSWVIPFSV